MTGGLGPDILDTVLQSLHEFARRELPFSLRRKWDRDDRFPKEILRKMLGRELGIQLLFFKAEYGGMGGSTRDAVETCAALARVDVGIATAILAIVLGAEPFVAGGTEAQKTMWLNRIAGENQIAACAMTEPQSGSAVDRLQTRADRITDDSGITTHYRLNGVKQFISNGGIADVYTILAQAPGGSSFFVVERRTAGLDVGRPEEKHGIRLSNTSQVILEDAVVPAANLIGDIEGKGPGQVNAVFGATRLMVAAMGLGAGELCLERACTWATERRLADTLLSEKQGYTHKLLVSGSVRLAAARAYIEHVCARVDEESVSLPLEAAIAKLFATEIACAAADNTMQALGGYGYCTDYEVEKICRDVRILRIYEGTSEILQNLIGVFRIRQVVRSKGAFYMEMGASVQHLTRTGGPIIATSAELLSQATLAVFSQKRMRQQHIIFSLATLMTEVEVAVQVCLAANRSSEDLLPAQSRVFAREVVQTLASTLPALLIGSGMTNLESLQFERFYRFAIASQEGLLDDLNAVAKCITAAGASA